jgi:hypothetical protein
MEMLEETSLVQNGMNMILKKSISWIEHDHGRLSLFDILVILNISLETTQN